MSGRDGGPGPKERGGWRQLFRLPGGDPARETDEEIAFHLEMRIRDYLAAGMSEEEARAAAERRLGDVARVHEELGRMTRSDQRREWLADVQQDLRYGARTLLGAPTFTAMAVGTLALGIGATTAIFSLVWAVLLAPLPYPEPDRLVRLWETSPQGATRNVVSSGNVVDWQESARSFEVIGAHRAPFPVTLTGDGEPARVAFTAMQPAVARALGATPVLGRTFVAGDGVEGEAALVSHAFWRSRWGGSPDVLGRRLVLNDVPYTVVGVMPADFAFPDALVDVWVAMRDRALDPEERTSHNFQVLARLAPDVTVDGAQAEMSSLAARIAAEHPTEMTGWGVNVVPLHADLTAGVEPLFRVLLGGVAVVLLIACGNLANLLLARALARQREVSLRGALGAGRGRILRQLLTESALLAGLGGAGALLLAPLLLRMLVTAAPAGVPLLERAAVDGGMLAFAAAVALGCAALFGLAPALQLSRPDLQAALRAGQAASSRGHTRLRGGLLVAQVALSVVLLVGAGLFVRSFRALQATELGFEPAGLVLMDVDLPSARYPEIPGQVALYERLLERARAVPGVLAAAATSQPPGNGSGMTFSFAIEGREASNPSGREDDETLHAVTPGYFEVIGQRVVAGRAFDARDGADGLPVVILDESLARKHWPRGDAVGQRIAFRVGETPWLEVVGVVEETRLQSPDVAPQPAIYIPFAQKTWPWLTWTTVVARTQPGQDPSVMGGLRAALLELDPALPPQALSTVEAAFRANTSQRSFAMTLIGGFGVLALVLSVVGLYGLVSWSVARQRREIGVRIALGAEAGDVVGRVLRSSLALVLPGALGGLVVAALASGTIESLLYGVSPVDPASYAAAAALVVVVALATSWLPAARAARTDPIQTLRAE